MAEAALLNTTTSNVPDRIGKYLIINEVGQGSTGTVYLSHDPYYGRDVAIKVYNAEADGDPQGTRIARKMFFNEAHMVGMLQHPNILPILDAGEEDGKYYVVMDHVQGARTLSAYCRPDNLLPVDDVVEIIFKTARALNYAHARGVIHRDIKPNNIMLTVDNDVRIIDFGIAILADADISRIEGIAGSPSYMSPEQIQSAELTQASDIYSLGAVMYELLTGFRPYRASSLSKLLHQIVYATAPPIHTLRADVPEELEHAVAMAMQKDPEKRYASGGEFAARLTDVYKGLRERSGNADNRDRFDLLRRSRFFHDFSHAQIWEVLKASEWRESGDGQEIVRQGDADDLFYVLISGEAEVRRDGQLLATLSDGACFGESGYVPEARRTATISARGPVTLLSVSATLLEQVSAECQLLFSRVFLRTLIQRLQDAPAESPRI